MEKEDKNILAQNKVIEIPLQHNGELLELELTYTRLEISQIVDDVNTPGKKPSEINRKWLLAGLKDPEQKKKVLEVINARENFTLENDIMGAVSPLLNENQATIGTPKVVS